jgi:hypothetical protein
MFHNFFPISCHLRDYVGKCGTAEEAIDENIIWAMSFEFWINTGIETQNM